MLSIVVYGRNDQHGYNLHKRAAISLNCLAELLHRPDDEILFVDYNTPDTLPTFPEAIADTLTARTRRHLRVLRVRPSHHDAIRALTHLEVCEPVARNVALRRANRANQWVLSTNTDMILVPRTPLRLLADMVADLPARCHHLPRFELPQVLWEEFDRTDPAGTMRLLAEMGPRLHLHDVVEGSPPARFDNHGDFQLIPRADLEAVHGFDERMRNGWIVDSNLAKRLSFRLGLPLSLEERLAGFHCDHTRVGGIFHGRNHVENDYWRFYQDVAAAELPHQAESWGLAGETLEEIRLDRRSASMAVRLAAMLPEPAQVPSHSTCRPDRFDISAYGAEHVLPFVVDLLANLPRDTSLGWFGVRASMEALVRSAWTELGFTGAFVANDLDADVLVFEFGRKSQDGRMPEESGWNDEDLDALAPVHAALLALVAIEQARQAEGRRARMVIAINAINNRFEPLVHECLSVARTPFGARVRHGAVLPKAPPPPRLCPPDLAAWLTRRLDRAPVPITEAVRLLTLAEAYLDGDVADWHRRLAARAAETLLACLDFPPLAQRHSGAAIAQARNRIAADRPSTRTLDRLAVPLAGARPSPLAAPCRLAGLDDWEDGCWLETARRYGAGAFAGNLFRRSQTDWTVTQVVAVGMHLGVLGDGKRVLIEGADGEPLAAVLSRLCAEVTIAGGAAPGALIHVPGRIRRLAQAPTTDPHDMVIVDAADALPRAARLVAPGGMVVLAMRQRLDTPLPIPTPAGLTALPAAPEGVSRATLDLLVDDDLRLAGTWFFRP